MTITRANIIEAVYSHLGVVKTKQEAARLVEGVFETIKETLESGERIKISGFGNFEIRDKWERTGRNPRTGAPIAVGARRVVTFKPSLILRQAVNDTAEGQGPFSEPLPSANE